MEYSEIKWLLIIQFCSEISLGKYHVCMKFISLEDQIQLICSVDPLQNSVEFINPVGKENGRCEPPIWKPKRSVQCEQNYNISQDLQHNKTVLTIKKSEASAYGLWTCNHGTNTGSDTINTTILSEKIPWRELTISVLVMIGFTILTLLSRKIYYKGKMALTGQDSIEEKRPFLKSKDEMAEDNQNKISDENRCLTCSLKNVCALCSDCTATFCETCCLTHTRTEPDHKVCLIEHVVSTNFDATCKQCRKQADRVCMKCLKVICSECSTEHSVQGHKLKLLMKNTSASSGDRIVGNNVACILYKYKLTMEHKTNRLQPRICGVCFIEDEHIVVVDMNNSTLNIYKMNICLLTYDLDKEPKAMTRISDTDIAITFPYEREIGLYNFKSKRKKVQEVRKIKLSLGKPFSIAYNQDHFAVEIGEGDDGVIVILNMHGKIVSTIKNINSFAYFTSNTIRLSLHFADRKIFVVALSKKEVSCVDFEGYILWSTSIPSPRGIVFVPQTTSDTDIIIASKRWNLLFKMNSSNGTNDIITAGGHLKGPRFIDYNLTRKRLCVQNDNGEVVVYEYDINTK